MNARLLVQPESGVGPLVQAIDAAKNRVEIVIFRFDYAEIEHALSRAVSRGVFVQALIAFTNRGGEKALRDLEMRLLAAGITVARTSDDLVRYHGKLIIIDRRELHLLSFNFTHLDIDHSRSFGFITRNPKLVQEAEKLFEADATRQPYNPGLSTLVVSPLNARKQLSAFIRGARKQLLIYDPEISDAAMIRLLQDRAKAGVEIKIIGRVAQASAQLPARKLAQMRLHTRTIIRDGRKAFIGSQSLREVELGLRREVGVVFSDSKIIARLSKIFLEDWEAVPEAGPLKDADALAEPAAKVAKRVAKAVTKDLPPFAPVVEVVVKDLLGVETDVELDHTQVEEAIKDAVKEAVKEAVKDVVEEVVSQT
jgi:phosphatidylserine/phosphatidylglycerophosphate/cardiolipin synthase-like enzyme